MAYTIANKIFKKGDKFYFADKSFVIGAMCSETMIFPCTKSGEVTSWIEEYCDRSDMTLDQCIEEFMQL